MESLSRPLHRRELSNANSFSSKNAYDDVVFTGAPEVGNQTYLPRIEDYSEIFGGSRASRASSIPIIDLSVLDGAGKVSADARSTKLDYSKIFGGFRDENMGVSYEEMLVKPKGAKISFGEARTSSKTSAPDDGSAQLNLHKEEDCQYEASTQFEGMKQFNMSYNKTSHKSNDGTNGTTHITQLHAVPGFTCFLDGNHGNNPLHKTEGSKSAIPPKDDANLTEKQTSNGRPKFKSQLDKYHSVEKPCGANDTNSKIQAPKISSPSSLPGSLVGNKTEPKKSTDLKFKVPKSDASKTGPGHCSPSFSDEEVDENSAAAAPVAALRKAIEKAQASIRIAKELMERKKDGPQKFSKPSSKNGFDIKKKREEKVKIEACRIKDMNTEETGDNADIFLQVFTKSEKERARKNGRVAPDLREIEEIFSFKEVVGETNGNKLESAKDCEAVGQSSEMSNEDECRAGTLSRKCGDDKNNIMESPECRKKEMDIGQEILQQLDGNVEEEEQDTCELKDLEEKPNAVNMVGDPGHNVYGFDAAQEVHDQEGIEKAEVREVHEKTEKLEDSVGLENYDEETEVAVKPKENQELESWNDNDNVVLDGEQECRTIKKKGVTENEQSFMLLEVVHGEEEGKNRVKPMDEQHKIEKIQEAVSEWVDYEQACEIETNEKRDNDVHKGDDSDKTLDQIYEMVTNKMRLSETANRESKERQQDGHCEARKQILAEECQNIERQQDSHYVASKQILAEECQQIEGQQDSKLILEEAYHFTENDSMKGESEGIEATDLNQEAVEETMDLDATSNACQYDADEADSECQEVHRHQQNDSDFDFEESEAMTDVSHSSSKFKEDDIGLADDSVTEELGNEDVCEAGSLVQSPAGNTGIENKEADASDAHFDDISQNVGLTDLNSEPKQTEQNEVESKLASDLGCDIKIATSKSGKDEIKFEDKMAFDVQEVEINSDTADKERQSIEMGNEMEVPQPPSALEREEKTTVKEEEIKMNQTRNKNEASVNKPVAIEEKETKITSRRVVNVEKHLRQNDEANRKEREREKDRVAVERAIREARERAFAEARERAERAAVEKASAEARQRVLVEAREKFEKASAATKPSATKASKEAKLKAERAAVERATAEARERALEKALSQKATSGAREQSDRFSGVSRDDGTRHSFSSSDTQKADGANGESAQRRKAKLERHQRTMERAAKALAEKNMRDLLAQKEQAERNRLAETLDAEVKRWANGKEGNLRALLSTLQYILGPDSGWQPISLTDIITTNAVKKAYRKATLHVHPDKLQQRGASIQQKYICEKVFDLLKAAWNKFNSEER